MAHNTSGGNAAFKNYNNQYAHIEDPNERRRLALAEIDAAPFGWYHVRTILVAGMGFFTDAYDIFAIGLVNPLLGIVYFGGTIDSTADTAIKVATSSGTVIGQVGFGILADVVGRKRMYGLELIIIIFATLAQALSASSSAITIVGVLIFWRVLMGIGIGGDYPLSSIITSEFATTKWRGAMMGAVFANQGWGQFAAGIIALIVTAGFKQSFLLGQGATAKAALAACSANINCNAAADKSWRVIIGFGAVPACIALYYRLTIPETPRYTFDITRDVEKAGEDVKAFVQGKPEGHPDEITRLQALQNAQEHLVQPKAGVKDFFRYLSYWRNGSVLFGTAASWFTLDVAFYGLGLNNSVILGGIGYSSSGSAYNQLYNAAVGNIILVCAGAIPGYWVTVATVDTIGRKPIQLGGFIILTILFCIFGFAYYEISTGAKLALYVLCQFFFNFGPNATTFIVPGEVFPTRYRSSCHGISAASGKVGSIIAQALIGPLRTRGGTTANPNAWLNHVMEIFAFFMFLGIFTTLLIPETKRKTLEQLSGEDIAVNGHLQSSYNNGGNAAYGAGAATDEKVVSSEQASNEVKA